MKSWRAFSVLIPIVLPVSLGVALWTKEIAKRQGAEWEIVIPPEEQEQNEDR